MTWPTPVDRVSTVAALAVTVTCSPTLPDRQRDVDRGIGVDLQDDALLHVGVESLQRRPSACTGRPAGSETRRRRRRR